MNSLLNAFFAAAAATAGVVLGRWFSRLRSHWWTLGFFIPMGLILVYRAALSFPALSLAPPASWMLVGLRKYAVLGFVTTMVLTTPLSRIPRRRERILICAFMATLVLERSIWPLLAPLAERRELARLQTKMAPGGVCLQTTEYTCGPASAVTALRKLGLSADESGIALLSNTSSSTGTEPDLLAAALRKEYGADGLRAEYRFFHNIAELRQAGLTLAVVKFGFLVDHFVTVLEVTDSEVVVGDPLNGVDRMTHDDFLKKWRFYGVVLSRQKPIVASTR